MHNRLHAEYALTYHLFNRDPSKGLGLNYLEQAVAYGMILTLLRSFLRKKEVQIDTSMT